MRVFLNYPVYVKSTLGGLAELGNQTVRHSVGFIDIYKHKKKKG